MSFTALPIDKYKSLKDYPILTYGLAKSPYGTMAVAWWPDAKKGDLLCYLALQAGDMTALEALSRLFPRNPAARDDKKAASFVKNYFKGGKLNDAPAVLMKGTPFYLNVWQKLFATKRGQTLSYSELATKAGSPRAARAVGHAMSTNPIALVVPCHRVIANSGSLNCYAYGNDLKKILLEQEKQS